MRIQEDKYLHNGIFFFTQTQLLLDSPLFIPTIRNMNSLNAGKCQGLPGEICSRSGLVCCWALTERIAKVAPMENHCMLENVDDSVDYVHLIPPMGIPSAVSYFLTLSHEVGKINDF